jgi:hypothetical protein
MTEQSCFMRFASQAERSITNHLIADILSAGHSVSVWDGEAWGLKLSKDAKAIREALATTDHDTIRIRDGADPKRLIGSVVLIWGNECDLISDSSDNDEIAALLKGAEARAEQLQS